mgnify:CR=1 FL=1
MGLMSIVNSLASSPIGKVAGGFLEGEIDERKEAARLQEEKDKRYAEIESKIGKGKYKNRIEHHKQCRIGGKPIYKECNKEWFWD